MRKRKAEGHSASQGPKPKRTKASKKTHDLKPFWNDRMTQRTGDFWDATTATGMSDDGPSYRRLVTNSWFHVKFEGTDRRDPSAYLKDLDIKMKEKESRMPKPKATKKKAEKTQQEIDDEHAKRTEEWAVKRAEHFRKKEAGEKVKRCPPRKPATPARKAELASNQEKRTKAGRARSVLLHLDKDQRDTLSRWTGTYRWTYNQCVALLQNKPADLKINKQYLRDELVYTTSPAYNDHVWLKETPQEVRDAAVCEFMTAYKANMDKYEQKRAEGKTGLKPFKMHFKKRKLANEAIAIRKAFYKDGVPYKTYWQTPGENGRPLQKLKSKMHDLPKKLNFDSKILRKRDRYFLAVALAMPEPRTGVPLPRGDLEPKGPRKTHDSWLDIQEPEQVDSSKKPVNKIASIDPGVRTFASIYDPDGTYMRWAPDDIQRIKRLAHHADKLQSKWSDKKSYNARKRFRMRKAWHRMLDRIRHLIDECQRKLAKFLCESYNVVLIPTFETSNMVKKKDHQTGERVSRRLNRSTARMMMTWSHYRFRCHLKDKAKEYPWVEIVDVTEEYTSKTCGRCGKINDKLGGAKVFRCSSCGYRVDRDLNGARNILLKWLFT